jgi:hypothetical protein
MHGARHPFFELKVATKLVRDGKDAELWDKTGKSLHTLLPVYGEMLLQICRDYPALPNPRSLTMGEIRFFYNGSRNILHEMTRPRK